MKLQQPVFSLHTLILLILVVPAVVFMAAIIRYSVNIPQWDDITQILWVINAFVDGKMSPGTPDYVFPIDGRLHAIFYPNAGHVPMVTRLFALIQYALGGVNFYYGTIVSCGFWVVTVYFLLRYILRQGLPLYTLLPLPFLFFSLAHWEVMVMLLGAIQMYIGTLFLPLLALYALTKERAMLAAIIFFLALFSSGGAMSLLLLGTGYLLWQQRWKSAFIFVAASLPAVLLFRHLDVFGPYIMSQHLKGFKLESAADWLSTLAAKITYLLIFLGNITTTTSELRTLETVHFITGSLLLILGFFAVIACRGYHFIKLIVLYVLLLAGITTLMRSDDGGSIVSRYSVFALLATGSVYTLIVAWWRERQPRAVNLFVLSATLCSAVLWGYSLVSGSANLARIHDMRIYDMDHYIQTGDALHLMWAPEWCIDILNESKRLGVYDYSDPKNLH